MWEAFEKLTERENKMHTFPGETAKIPKNVLTTTEEGGLFWMPVIHDTCSTSTALLRCCLCVPGEEVCWGLWADQWEDHGAPGGPGEAEEAGGANWPVRGWCHCGNPGPRAVWGNGMPSKVATKPLAFPFWLLQNPVQKCSLDLSGCESHTFPLSWNNSNVGALKWGLKAKCVFKLFLCWHLSFVFSYLLN